MIKLNLRAKMPFAALLAMPLDKGAGSFGQSGNDPRNDFFDQYLTFNTVNVDGSVYLTAPESTLLVSKAKGSDSAGTSTKMWKDEAGQNLPQHLRGEPPQGESAASLNDKSEGNAFRFQDSGRAAGPEFALLSLEKARSPRLKCPPPSPELLVNRKTRERHQILEGFHKPFQNEKEIKTLRKSTSPIRKATSPAKMRRSQYTEQNIHDWGQRIASDDPKFDFGFQHTGTLSPPPSGQASESSDNNNHMMAVTQQHDGTFAWDHPISEQYAYRTTEDTDSPLTTPPADNASFHQSNMHNASSNNMIYATSHRHQSSASWVQAPVNSDYTFEASTPYVEEQDSPIWWGNAATTSMAGPAPSGYQRQNQHNTQNLAMQLQAELAYTTNELSLSPSNMPSGQMIQMPNSPAGPFVVEASPIDREQGYFAPTAAASLPLQPHHHRYSQSQPQNYAPLPTTRQEKSHSHSRTESFSRSPSPRLRASSKHVSKKHSSSRKRAGENQTGGQKTPKGTMGLLAGFVNFTPSDKAKILTGVAPSGSSKTKARREKEAAEKTKRLSQAAVRAVQAAGGSIDTLVEEGLFDEPELEEMS
jgi:hypothetical protein